MELNVMIVDDDPTTSLYLKQVIEEVPEVNVVGIAMNGPEGLKKAYQYSPQLVFLDIDMPQMNGIELAHKLIEWRSDVSIVFVTAYTNYALEAFELYSFDYILKPFKEERIKLTLNKLKVLLNHENKNANIIIKVPGKRILLNSDEIVYIESTKPMVHIKTKSDAYLFRGSLTDVKTDLLKQGFFQSHRSYLVNLIYIKQIIKSANTYQILLTTNDRIMLSRKQELALRNLLPQITVAV